MLFPGQTYLNVRIKEFHEAIGKILPPGWKPLKVESEYGVYWHKIYAENQPDTPYRISEYESPGWQYPIVMGGVSTLVGCCGNAIITGINVYTAFQRKGLGTLMGKLLLHTSVRYSQVIGTVVANHEPMVKLVDKLGFTRHPGTQYKNRNTANPVVVCTRDVADGAVPPIL